MARNLILTDYKYQSLDEIKKDLIQWEKDIKISLAKAKKMLINLEKDKDWSNLNGDGFKNTSYKCFELLTSAYNDISLILKEMKQEVKEYHPKLLRRLGDEGSKLNEKIGIAKHQGGRYLSDSEYDLYGELRDSVYNLVDLQSVSERLTDFVGLNKSIPWANIISNIIAFIALILSFVAIFK